MAKALQMKLFHEHNQESIEAAVNEYLAEEGLVTEDYVDCKYQLIVSGPAQNEVHHFCVLLVYRKVL